MRQPLPASRWSRQAGRCLDSALLFLPQGALRRNPRRPPYQKKRTGLHRCVFSCLALRQMPLEVAAGVDPLLHHDERLGVDGAHRLLQRLDLVLAQTHAQHPHVVAGVGPQALPAGDAPADGLHDGFGQGLPLLLGDDQRLDGDVLLMHPVHHQGGDDGEDGGIDGGAGVEEHHADGEEHRVEHDGHPAHGDAPLLAQIQAQDIQAAGAAAAGEHQADGGAVDQSADETAGQHVLHHRLGRHRDHHHEHGAAHRAQNQLGHEGPAQGAPGQDHQRDIGRQVQRAGQIHVRHPDAQLRIQQGADHLAQTQYAAVIQPLGHDDPVDAEGHQQCGGHNAHHSQPAAVHRLVIHRHRSSLPAPAGSFANSLYGPGRKSQSFFQRLYRRARNRRSVARETVRDTTDLLTPSSSAISVTRIPRLKRISRI